jgi:hypothetical protein
LPWLLRDSLLAVTSVTMSVLLLTI